MKIAVLSDTRLPTNASFPGHGLGKLALSIFYGLAKREHDVILFAGKGSEPFAFVANDEREFAQMIDSHKPYDAILDNTHFHTLQNIMQKAPIVNVSHDREAAPGRCAVFPSKFHRDFHGYSEASARVIPHGVDAPQLSNVKKKPYYAYLSMFHSAKGPLMAAEAARIAGVELVMAGPTPPAPPPGVKYIGPLDDVDKWRFLAEAQALIYPASTESGGLVPLEAQAVGTPVVVSTYGAAREQIIEGVTGFAARDTLEMSECMTKASQLSSDACKTFVRDQRSVSKMIDAYELALQEVAKGVRW